MRQEAIHSEIKKAIRLAGGQAELGKMLDVKQQSVSKWLQKKCVPPQRAAKIEKLFNGIIKKSNLCPLVFNEND